MTKQTDSKSLFNLIVFGSAFILSVAVLYPFISQFFVKPVEKLSYVEVPPPLGQKPESMIFLLHGSGGSGQQMIDDLGGVVRQAFPEAMIISPDGPLVVKTPDYTNSFVWHEPFYAMMDGALGERIAEVSGLLETLIRQKQKEYPDIDTNRIFLLGFSQGATVALYTGPRLDPPIGGVLGYSGRLAKTDEEQELEHFNRIPVFMFYNDQDPWIGIENYKKAKAYFESEKFPIVSMTDSFQGHSISWKGMQAGMQFIRDNM